MAKIIGIDLGTSNSCAAVLEGGKGKVIPSAEGSTIAGKTVPSFVAFTKDGQVLVGEPARRQAVTNPEGTVYAAKRKMGTSHKYKLFGKEYTPQQISAFILKKIKKEAEDFLGEKVEKAVITVPAYFDDNQRQATKDAGTIAGLEVVRIINEPTAASLAYGLDKQHKELKVLVFDLGGGTLDVTIMEFGDGVFEVKSTSGDTQLGGTDMDNALINHLVSEFRQQEGIDLSNDKMAMHRLREAAEKAKIELSTVNETEINLPFITANQDGPKHFIHKMSRAKLESFVKPIVDKCKGPVEQALKDAGFTTANIDKVILVGGPTRMPIVQKFVEDNLGKKIERGVDPMECVAQGAAIQAGVLAGEVKDILLLDVTPLSLGIETLGGIFTKLIDRNTTVPTKKSQIFSTASDNQTAVTIRVHQGERPMVADNKHLGQFDLIGLPPAPRGIPQIEVTFDIDANGIVHVTAKDLGTGKVQSIRITSTQKLSEEEIKRMKKEAEEYAEKDKQRMEEVQTVNEADTLVYTAQNLLKDFKGKVPDDKITAIENKIEELKAELKKEPRDTGNIKSKLEEANKVIQEASIEMYKKAQSQGDGGAGGNSSNDSNGNSGSTGAGNGPDFVNPEDNPAKDNTVDADYEETKK